MRKLGVIGASLGVAGVSAVGVVLAAFDDPARALLAWIAAYGFALGTVLGALILVMLFHVTRATWPVVLRPLLMAISATAPAFALLFVPIAIGARRLYPWARSAWVTHDGEPLDTEVAHALEHQRTWNHLTFFLVRASLYLGSWILLAALLRRARERTLSEEVAARERRISAAGLPIVAFTLTFAAFDWLMSLEPGWVSNMYGLYFFAGGLASATSLVALLAWAASRQGAVAGTRPDHFHAIGRLMLMATIFWAYIAFFQLMLVWIADLPRESSFFITRARGPYRTLTTLLVIGHFVVPFLALLSRPLKRRAGVLAAVAAWIIVMDAVDLVWLVLPSGTSDVRVLDGAPFLVIGGLTLAYGARQARRTSRRAAGPELASSLEYRSP
jgi:hypothetical protein